jgi:hypothetical protein
VDRTAGHRSVTGGSNFPGAGAVTWRPRPALLAVGFIGALAAVTWVVFTPNPLDRLTGGALAVALTAVTAIGWRRRLVGGPRGLLVGGWRGNRIVPWSDVRNVEGATSRRFGLSTATLEIDLQDDDLLVFGRTDLGTDPSEVLIALRAWWR